MESKDKRASDLTGKTDCTVLTGQRGQGIQEWPLGKMQGPPHFSSHEVHRDHVRRARLAKATLIIQCIFKKRLRSVSGIKGENWKRQAQNE